MRTPSSREGLRALPDWSAVPSNSEEDRLLVNQRIAYFGAVVGALSAAFYVFNQGLGVIISPDWKRQLVHPATMMHLAAIATFSGLWALCRGGRRSSAELNVIDVGGLLLASTLYSLMIGLSPRANFQQSLILTLVVVLMLSTHAIIVPATARRTTWITALAALPVPLTAYVVATRNPGEQLAGQPWMGLAAAAFISMWCLTGIATCALASKIIYGLQQRVRAASELGQYTLEQKIGEGGMGAVYRARHALLRRPTAIKLLSTARANEPQIRRFEREVQLTASLSHPNTIAIYDFGRTPDGVFYYAMEFIDGITLDELVQHEGPQEPRRVAHLLIQVCSALVEAHGLGLVHRDIKPANIMLSLRGGVADQITVLDFGLVRELSDPDPGASAQNTLIGTPLYLAPEAITNPASANARSDLYALRIVGYQLLTGRPPFEGRTILEVCSKHLFAEPVPPSAMGAMDLPPAFDRLILACLAKLPEQRPPSAENLRDQLRSLELADWSAAEARAWWDGEGPKVVAAARATRADSRPSSPVTIAVDLANRSREPRRT